LGNNVSSFIEESSDSIVSTRIEESLSSSSALSDFALEFWQGWIWRLTTLPIFALNPFVRVILFSAVYSAVPPDAISLEANNWSLASSKSVWLLKTFWVTFIIGIQPFPLPPPDGGLLVQLVIVIWLLLGYAQPEQPTCGLTGQV